MNFDLDCDVVLVAGGLEQAVIVRERHLVLAGMLTAERSLTLQSTQTQKDNYL